MTQQHLPNTGLKHGTDERNFMAIDTKYKIKRCVWRGNTTQPRPHNNAGRSANDWPDAIRSFCLIRSRHQDKMPNEMQTVSRRKVIFDSELCNDHALFRQSRIVLPDGPQEIVPSVTWSRGSFATLHSCWAGLERTYSANGYQTHSSSIGDDYEIYREDLGGARIGIPMEINDRYQAPLHSTIRSTLCLRRINIDSRCLSRCIGHSKMEDWSIHDLDFGRGYLDQFRLDTIRGCNGSKSYSFVRSYIDGFIWNSICFVWKLLGVTCCCNCRCCKSKVSLLSAMKHST